MKQTLSQRNVLVLGATSSMAKPLCEQMAKRGWRFVLAGRDDEELQRLKSDLEIRYGVVAEVLPCDLADPHFSGEQCIAEASNFGELDLLVVAAGEMGDAKLRSDSQEIERVVRVTYLSPIKVMASFAEKAQARRYGDMIVIASVAGDRGRQSNYLYGSAKGGLSLFAAGLRNRLARHGCRVLTVKPGFVDTPMTYTLNSPLVAPREQVAALILKAYDRKADEIYVPGIWRWIMLIIRNIPETIFKKMRL